MYITPPHHLFNINPHQSWPHLQHLSPPTELHNAPLAYDRPGLVIAPSFVMSAFGAELAWTWSASTQGSGGHEGHEGGNEGESTSFSPILPHPPFLGHEDASTPISP